MNLTSNGKVIGEVKRVETGIPGILPVIVFVITDEDMRKDLNAKIDASEASGESSDNTVEFQE